MDYIEWKVRQRMKKPQPFHEHLLHVIGESAPARNISRVFLWPIVRATLGPEDAAAMWESLGRPSEPIQPPPIPWESVSIPEKDEETERLKKEMAERNAARIEELKREAAAMRQRAAERKRQRSDPRWIAQQQAHHMLRRLSADEAERVHQAVKTIRAALEAQEAGLTGTRAALVPLSASGAGPAQVALGAIRAALDAAGMPVDPDQPPSLQVTRALDEELARGIPLKRKEEEAQRVQAWVVIELARAKAREAERQALKQLIETEGAGSRTSDVEKPAPGMPEQKATAAPVTPDEYERWFQDEARAAAIWQAYQKKQEQTATEAGISPEEQQRRQIAEAQAEAARRASQMSWGKQVELRRRAREAARREREALATARWNSLPERAKQYVNMIADRQLDQYTLSRVWRSPDFQKAIQYLGITDLRPYIKKSAAPPPQEAEQKRSAGMGRSQLAEALVSPDVAALRDRLFALEHVDKDALLSYLRGRVQRGDMAAEDANWLVGQLEAENVRRRRLNRLGLASRRAWRDVARIAESIPERPRVPNPMRTFVSLYNRLAYPQEAALREAAAAQSALMQQEMISRGLSNTSVLAGAQRGIQSALGRDISLMRAQTAQTAAALTPGLMPPVLVPDYSELQNMAYLAGYGSLRRRRSLAAALQ